MSRRFGIVRFILWVIAFAGFTDQGQAQWPGFRGDDKHGQLPSNTRLLPGLAETPKWTATTRGSGVSSPVVDHNLLVLTTSQSAPSEPWLRGLLLAGSAVLSVVIGRFGKANFPAQWPLFLVPLASSAILLFGAPLWREFTKLEWQALAGLHSLLLVISALFMKSFTCRGGPALAIIACGITILVGLASDYDRRQWSFVPGMICAALATVVVCQKWEPVEGPGNRLRESLIIVAGVASTLLVVVGALAETERRRISHSVVALSPDTGQKQWTWKGFYRTAPVVHVLNSPAAPTPFITKNRVVSWFGSSGIVGLDHTGRKIWERVDLPFTSPFGAAASPIAHDGRVFVSGGGTNEPYIAALDSETGASLWRVALPLARGTNGNNRTPTILRRGGKTYVLLWQLEELLGFSAENGNQEFKYEIVKNLDYASFVASPIIHDNALYLAADNAVVKLSIANLVDGTDPLIWISRGSGADCASPVIANDHVFTVSETGTVAVRRVDNGRIAGTLELDEPEVYASPVTDGDHVMICGLSGNCFGIDVRPPFAAKLVRKFAQPVLASPGVSLDSLYVRSGTSLDAFPLALPQTLTRSNSNTKSIPVLGSMVEE